jgi:hypothetical protein
MQSRPKADVISLPIGSQSEGVLRLEQGEAIKALRYGWRTMTQFD